MSRTTIEVPMKTNSIDEVLRIVKTRLELDGFQEKIVDGDTLWVKGDGVIAKMQCVSTVFTVKSVVIQAWMKDAMTGESDLEGFVAMLPKKKLKKALEEISNAIYRENL